MGGTAGTHSRGGGETLGFEVKGKGCEDFDETLIYRSNFQHQQTEEYI